MKKILCIGSAGFVLGNFIRKLIYNKENKDKYSLVSIDRLTDAKLSSVYTNRSNIFYLADVRDYHILDRIFEHEKPNIVIYGASPDVNINQSHTYESDNFYTEEIDKVCIVAKKYNTEKIIYLSCDVVYDVSNSDRHETDNINSNFIDYYSEKKRQEEIAIIKQPLNYNILRLSNQYGPWNKPNKFIAKTFKNIMNKEPIMIYGDGSQERDWTCVFDTCSAIMHLLEKGGDNQIYNISSGQKFSVLEVANMVCNAMGSGHELISFAKGVTGQNYSRSLNTDKLKETGWKSEYKLKDGLEITNQWVKNNPWIFR